MVIYKLINYFYLFINQSIIQSITIKKKEYINPYWSTTFKVF